MRTDTIFYELFRTFPSLLFELIGKEPALAKAYQFTSVEVKELARTMDGLFLPTDKTSPIYFLEVQFQKDNDFYWRLVTEVFVYLGQYKPQRNWQAIVVWSKRSFDPGVPIPYQTLLVSNQIRQVYLDELEPLEKGSVALDIVKFVVESEDKASKQIKPLIQRTRQEVKDESLKINLIELIEKVIVYKFGYKKRQELKNMLKLSDWQDTNLYHVLKEKINEEVKQEIEEKVQQEVKEKAKLESVPRFLKLGLTVEQIAQALDLSITTVRQAADEQ